MIKSLLLIGCLLVSGIVCAKDEWIKAGETTNSAFYLNPTRIAIINESSQILELWAKSVTKNDYVGNNGSKAKKGNYGLYKKQYDCLLNRYKNIYGALYEKGHQPQTYAMPNPQWEEVVPESIDELIFRAVCATKFPATTS